MLLVAIFCAPLSAQLQQGTIVGTVVGPDGLAIVLADVTLVDQLGNAVTSVIATNGEFRITNVAMGRYSLRAAAPPFEAVVQTLTIADALPVALELKLSAALAEQVNVTAESSQPVTTTTRTTLAGDAVRRAPIRISSRGLQDAIATTPGWATEDNGLLHARGVDDGFLYVVDGVPMYERLDSLHGVAPDPEMVESINVLVGHVPPEFGFKSGGVIEVRTSNRKSDSWLGNLQGIFGSDVAGQSSAIAGGPLSDSTALTVGVSGQMSDRFLDPVHPDNLHNSGNATNATAEFSWPSLRQARYRSSAVSAVRASTFRTVRSRKKPDRTSGRETCSHGRRRRGSARGRRYGLAGRRVSPIGLGRAVWQCQRYTAVPDGRPHPPPRWGPWERDASSRQTCRQVRCRGRTTQSRGAILVLRCRRRRRRGGRSQRRRARA